jgi:hypothetical protein
MRILPQDLDMLENLNFFTFCHSIAGLQFLISVKYVIIFNILDSILKKFSGKSLVHQLFIGLELN